MERTEFSKPLYITTWMGIFLALVLLLAALLVPQLKHAFMANIAFNSVIVLVLCTGIAVNLRQVWHLQHEVNWINSFYKPSGSPLHEQRPELLASMVQILSTQRGQLTLSPTSMRSILDSVQIRLDEQRDMSRYIIGLLIFLGLLGTFWGLLATIRSVGEIIDSMGGSGDATALFDALKIKLHEPLNGMATSFSTSLFGLAGSLVVGFLDLQAGHAQGRFYNDLEDWLSAITRIPLHAGTDGEIAMPSYVQALLEQTAENLDRMQRSITEADKERHASCHHLAELNHHLQNLAELTGREARDLTAMAEIQSDLRTLVRQIAQRPNDQNHFSEELRSELRLMSRTIATALNQHNTAAGPDHV